MELPKGYNPSDHEDAIYKRWEDSGTFNPDNLPGERTESFSTILPPPNVTGQLHVGHAAMLTIEDIMTRYHRLQGKKALWLPGTDHAAIATETKVAKLLQKEGINRRDLGREEFLKRVDTFAAESHDTITGQMQKMGASVDWSREAFTLDEKRSFAVRTAFKQMYGAGLIYRGDRIVNWDPKGQTTVSDDEVNHEEREGKFYTFKYSKDFPISIATTRPETKIGDTAVAVHPDDGRYSKYIGNVYNIEFVGVPLEITIIADKEIDPEFGTGAVGITPAHSMVDWEIGQRHNLKSVQVINEYAKMMLGPEGIKDQKTLVAREFIVEKLRADGLLEKEEDVKQNISIAERSGGIIEPLPKLQWWIDVNKKFPMKHSNITGIKVGDELTLKELMLHVVETDQINILPDRFGKVYRHWIANLRDWCISRQIWYGHRLPVWYKGEEIYVGTEAPKGDGWEQDADTLDTWFSSGLWTFSTLGWPEQTDDLKTYHPTTVLETGYDILFFWVARMILMTGFLLGEVPFKTVYLHGLVRDEKGNKLSKSLGNAVDPLEIIEKFGADALRMSLIIGTAPGGDSKLSEANTKGYKHFANKIWNASKFIASYTENTNLHTIPDLTPTHQKHIDEYHALVRDVTSDMESYRFYLAGEKLYHYFWHTLADNIIEGVKPILQSEGDSPEKTSALYTLKYLGLGTITMLHPFMPFVTEHVWTIFPEHHNQLLMTNSWPQASTQQ